MLPPPNHVPMHKSAIEVWLQGIDYAERDAFSEFAATSLTSPTDVIPDLSPSSPRSSTTGRSTTSFPSDSLSSSNVAKLGGSKNLVRTMADLAANSKRVTRRSLDCGVPEDVQDLFKKLDAISHGENLIPAAAADRFERPHMPLRPWQIDNVTPYNINELENEIDMAKEISERANSLAEEGHSELSWNCEVHSPILRLGLARHDRARHFNITTATICSTLVPISEKTGLVGYSLNLDPARDTPLSDAIDTFVATQPPDMRTISPTMYDPVRWRPLAVVIETKRLNSSSDPLVQLTIWAQATFARFRRLIYSKYGSDGICLLTLPLIAIRGHEWHLWFSHDTARTFELYGPLKIGSTETLMNIFKLIRSLRTLSEWIHTEFYVWIESAFGLPLGAKDTEG